jgi:hypothetical protein
MAHEHDDRHTSSMPPRFSADEREHLLAQLKKVNDRVSLLELRAQQKSQLSEYVTDIRRAVDELSNEVREMLARDIKQERDFGELKLRVEQIAAASGGMVGGFVGGVTGRDSAREENRGNTAKNSVLALLIAAVTSIVIAYLQIAFSKPVAPPPPPPIVTVPMGHS